MELTRAIRNYGLIGASPCDGPCPTDPNQPTAPSNTSEVPSSTTSTSAASSTDASSTGASNADTVSTSASSTAAPVRRDAAADLEERQFGGFGGGRGYGGPHRTYGERTDFGIIDYATHVRRPFVPKTSDYIDPIAAPSPTDVAPSSPSVAQPVATETGGIAYHQVFRQTPLAFSEVGDQTEYGNWYVYLRAV